MCEYKPCFPLNMANAVYVQITNFTGGSSLKDVLQIGKVKNQSK